jgi:hypothetical protein
MEEILILFGAVFVLLTTACGFGYANNVADNNAIEALITKGVPVLEAKCAIRPSRECEAILGVLKAKGD